MPLIDAKLLLLEKDKTKAAEKLTAAKTIIDDMGVHRWDIDVKGLEKRLA